MTGRACQTNVRTTRAFTLLEVMAALVIMSVALSVVLLERNNAIRRTNRTQARRVALDLARQKISEIRLGLEEGAAGNFDQNPGYRWEAVQDVDIASTGGADITLRRIDVTVFFKLRTGEDRVRLTASMRE